MAGEKATCKLGFYMNRLLLTLIVFSFGELMAQTPEGRLPRIELTTIEGKKFELGDDEKPSVVVFLSTSCPLSQKYTLTLNELAKEFTNKVNFYGVFAESGTATAEYKKFQIKYDMKFGLYLDDDKELVRALGASVTPECFVLNKGKVLYHGAIDNWVIALGRTKNKATVSFLKDAVQSVLSNKSPAPEYIKPTGCLID